LLVFVALVLASSSRPLLGWVPALVLAVVLSIAAVDDHAMLASFRRRRFGYEPNLTAKPEEALRVLVDAWCQRGELAPLRTTLPVLGNDGRCIPDPARTCTALQIVVGFPDSEVFPSEKAVLSGVIAVLNDRIVPSAGSQGDAA
jgi:hypothetical protein